MSNAIFPATTSPNLASGFNWGVDLKVTPQFKTLVQTPASGRGELRIPLMTYPRWMFELDIPFIFGEPGNINSGYQQLIGFYGQMQGQADDWLFDWPGNDQVTTPEVIAVGDGVGVTAVMTHAVGGLIELVQNFNGVPTIYVGGSPLSPSLWSLDVYGNLTFVNPPPNGDQVAWSGKWFTRCRFLADELQDLQLVRGGEASAIWALRSLKFISVLT